MGCGCGIPPSTCTLEDLLLKVLKEKSQQRNSREVAEKSQFREMARERVRCW
jgi:hypothetical protein